VTTKRAAIYVRISQDRAGAGLGVERQEEDCRSLAARLGWEVVDVYPDNDTSAYSGKPRKHYKRLLADIESGRVNAVLAWHTDRLHRNTRELLDYIELSNARKIPTQTVTAGPLDLSTANGRAAAITLGAWARAESEHKAERIARAHEQAAAQGRWRGGGRPFGYKSDGVTLEPSEARLARQAYKDVIAGKSMGAIIRDWKAAGVKTTTGKDWSYATLRMFLARERNYGASVHRGEVVGTGQWEPLVDEPTWRAVAAILSDPSRRTSDSTQGRWLLPGVALCGICDDGTQVKTATARSGKPGQRRSWTIYRCRKQLHLGRKAEAVDEYVTHTVLARLSLPDARDLLLADDQPDAEELRIEAEGLRVRIDEAADLWRDGLMSTPKYRANVEALQADLAAVEEKMADGDKAAVLAPLLAADDVYKAWGPIHIEPGKPHQGLSWGQRRAVVDLLYTVTILPVGKGNARKFHPESVVIEPR
jgi:DNA invertase Pin-like site-specific DNA recombinase